MTDAHGTPYGLGAHPSPPDPRDLSAMALLDTAAPLPARHLSRLLGPVLNQGNTGRCVAFSGTGLRQQQERSSGRWPTGWPALDSEWLYEHAEAIDGIPRPPGPNRGTTIRAALQVLARQGQPLAGEPQTANRFRISSYHAVPFTAAAIKAAIAQLGPVWIAFRFDRAWFHPVAGIMPAPSRVTEGGHAVYAFGWDDNVAGGSAVIRNSWSRAWGRNGNAYFPWRYLLPALHDAWAVLD